MEFKKIEEGMTATQVAELLDENFNNIAKEIEKNIGENNVPIATENRVGGITAKERTGFEQNEVVIDPETGRLYTKGVTVDGEFVPDEEDLTAVAEVDRVVARFKDRDTTKGKGYIILRTVKSLVEQMTQENTIYEVRYDFDLGGKTLEVPADCVLDFKGGCFKNGNIVFNKTFLDGIVNFDRTCIPSGSITNQEVLVDWFGATGDGITDNSYVLTNILELASTTNVSDTDYLSKTFTLVFNHGDYVVENPITDENSKYSKVCFHIKGSGMEGGTTILYKGPDDTFLFKNWGNFSYSTFDGIKFQGNNRNNCFLLKSESPNSGTQTFNFTNCRWTCFYKTFVSEGDSMCSEVSFINCKFVWFEDNSVIFTFNNQQAVNWRFFGTDIEQTYGTIFHLKQGTFISLFQSSIIPFGGIVIHIPTDANRSTFWYTNYPQVMMYSCRFELWNDTRLFVCQTPSDSGAKFVNCNMGGGMIQRTDGIYQIEMMKNITTELNNSKLVFEGCSDFRNYRAFVGAHLGNSNAGYLTFNNCLGFSVDTFIADSVFPSNANNEWMPKFYVDNIYQPYNSTMAKGYKQNTLDYILKHSSADSVCPNINAGETLSFSNSNFKLNRWVGSLTFNIMPTTDVKLTIKDTNNAKFYGIYNIKAWAAFDVTVKVGKYITSDNNLVISFTNTSESSCKIEGIIKVSEVYENANRVPFDKVSLDPNGMVDSSFCVYKESLAAPVWWDGYTNTWRDAEGFRSLLKRAGTTAQLSYPNSSDVGMMRFNTTLGKPVWWNGTQWVTSDGTAIS